MPSNRKVYQKKVGIKENFAFLKFFFRPLYAISLAYISRLTYYKIFRTVDSGTDALLLLKAGGPSPPSPLDPRFFFVHIAAEDRATQGCDPSAAARLRQGRGRLQYAPCTPLERW